VFFFVFNSKKRHFAGNLREIAKVEIIFNDLTQTQSEEEKNDRSFLICVKKKASFRNAALSNLKQTVQTLDPMLRDLTDVVNSSNYVLNEKVKQEKKKRKEKKKYTFLILF
jgi:hypothetical protein